MPRDNKNLLSQIDKMLSSRGKGLIYTNSLLGFCAKLVSTKPQANKDYRPKLLEKLTRQYSFSPAPALNILARLRSRAMFFRNPRFLTFSSLASLEMKACFPTRGRILSPDPPLLYRNFFKFLYNQKKIFNSFSLFSLQKLNLKATSILASLIFILILVSSLYPQKQSSLGKEGQNQEQLILSSEIPPRYGKTLEKDQTTQLINPSRLPGRIPRGNYRILQEDYGFRLIEYILPDGSRIKILKGLL